MLKYLLLILLVAGAWYGFRYVNRKADAKPPVTPPEPPPQVKEEARAEDLKPCPVCGAYLAESSAKSCGREACPYPRA